MEPSQRDAAETDALGRICRWLEADKQRMVALNAVAQASQRFGLELWLAAGFVRNLAWDQQYLDKQTGLNDLDVIYFDQHNLLPSRDTQVQTWLADRAGQFPWSVKNQARMHLRNGDKPYRGLVHAMSFWPELQTAVAVRLDGAGKIELVSAFGLSCLFDGCITHNPIKEAELFRYRVQKKGWQQRYPGLLLKCD